MYEVISYIWRSVINKYTTSYYCIYDWSFEYEIESQFTLSFLNYLKNTTYIHSTKTCMAAVKKQVCGRTPVETSLPTVQMLKLQTRLKKEMRPETSEALFTN